MDTISRELIQEAKQLLKNLGKGEISPSAYDTAWVARIPSKQNPNIPMFPQCLQWIIDNQLKDGGWGSSSTYHYYNDKLLSTLNCIITLQIWSTREYKDYTEQINQGLKYFNSHISLLSRDKYLSVGFEIIFPKLIEEARFLNIPIKNDLVFSSLLEKREKKLKSFNPWLISKHKTTILHSLEALDSEILNWEEFSKLQDEGGSFLTSPSSTAYAYLNSNNKNNLKYLKKILTHKTSVPVSTPMDIFEILWVIEIILNLNLYDYFKNDLRTYINKIKSYWTNDGISWSSKFHLPDLDDTSVAFYILKKAGYKPSQTAFNNFRNKDKIFCFPGELDSSPTHLIHLLQALLVDKTQPEFISMVRRRILHLLEGAGWHDKWHLSNYYIMGISMKPFIECDINHAKIMYKYIIKNQKIDGGWGYRKSNPEETAWACYALYIAVENQLINRDDVKEHLEKGVDFLIKYRKTFKYNLWIEKTLYTPHSIVDMLILSCILKSRL